MSLFETGDLFACFGADRVSRLISRVTLDPLAPRGLRIGPGHVAICCPDGNGQPLWVESTTLSQLPCCVTGRETPVGVQAHAPEDRLREYELAGGRVLQYRLTPVFQLETREAELLGHILLEHFVRKVLPYDLAGALTSGTRWFRLLPWLVSDVSRLFCSELIAAVLMRLGRLPLGNPARYHPARLLRELVRAGIYQLSESDRETARQGARALSSLRSSSGEQIV